MDAPGCITGHTLNAADRELLLLETGIGIGLVAMIEAAGYRSISEIKQKGVRSVLEHLCKISGCGVWMHREKALQRVISSSYPEGRHKD